MKKTSIPNLVKVIGYIKCYSPSSYRPVKSLSIAIPSDTTVGRSAVDLEDLKPYWKTEKGHISVGNQQAYYLQFL